MKNILAQQSRNKANEDETNDSGINFYSNDTTKYAMQNNFNNNNEANPEVLIILDQIKSSALQFEESNNSRSIDFLEHQHQQTCVCDNHVQTVNSMLEGGYSKSL